VPAEERYITSTVVLMTEIVKLIGSVVAVVYTSNIRTVYLFFVTWANWRNSWALIFPAVVYTCTNNLAYIALTYLPAAEFQLLTQGKTLTTALFAVTCLGTRLSRLQWMALILLVLGVMLAQLPQGGLSGGSAGAPRNRFTDDATSHFRGVCAVLTLCILSGAAGIYQEKILKQYCDLSINYLNAQLALFSLFTNGAAIFLQDSEVIFTHGFFHGYNTLTWCVVAVASLGGILVSLVIRHTSNLAKTYAVSMAILVVSFVSYLLDPQTTQLSLAWCLAACVVIISVLLFTDPVAQPPKLDAPKVAGVGASSSGAGLDISASSAASPSIAEAERELLLVGTPTADESADAPSRSMPSSLATADSAVIDLDQKNMTAPASRR
jgi:UDP-sugar transporter A1/2/3